MHYIELYGITALFNCHLFHLKRQHRIPDLNELIDFVKKEKVAYTLTSIAPNWCCMIAVWIAKIDSAD